eukprot:gene6271-6992_t
MGSYIKDGVFYEEVYDNVPFENLTGITVDRVLYRGRSKYQDILVFDSATSGRILVLDGLIQLTAKDEFAYHETLSFTALASHKDPKKVLIVGGGDGGMAREAAKFPSVESITICEIDEEVVNTCKKLFPKLSKSFSNPKVNLVIEDAFEYLKNKNNEYDVIISDSTDPNRDAGNNMWRPQLKGLQIQSGKHFTMVKFGFVSVPCYDVGQNGFVICSDEDEKASNRVTSPYWKFSDEEIDRMDLKFYNSQIHQYSFVLPTFLKKYLEESMSEKVDVVEWIESRKTKQNANEIIANGYNH